jgi:hypothetical protein
VLTGSAIAGEEAQKLNIAPARQHSIKDAAHRACSGRFHFSQMNNRAGRRQGNPDVVSVDTEVLESLQGDWMVGQVQRCSGRT